MRPSTFLAVTTAASWLWCGAQAQSAPRTTRMPRALPATTARASMTASIPKLNFEKYTLPNGLQVVLHVDRKLPVVHINQWFHVGSKNEKPGRTGFAHLFEHIMFQGSQNATGEYFSYVEKAGARDANGTTSFDRTNYFLTVPSGNLELVLWVESDRLATLADALTATKLDNQRDVVKNERRQSYENRPYGQAFIQLTENLHPAGHPYSWPIIGSHADLTAASLEDVKDFFRRYYTPNNLSLVIAGDIDVAQTKRWVAKYYGDVPRGPALEHIARNVPSLKGEKVVEVNDQVPQERVYMAWPAPPYFAAGDAELDIAANLLTDGLSSRLNKVLVYDKQLCSDVSAFNQSLEISGMFGIVATARPGVPLKQIEDIITQEIARLAQGGPTAAELNRVKTKLEYSFVSDLERISAKADTLNRYNTYLGDPNKLQADVLRYNRVTAQDVRRAVAQWINTPNRLLVRFHPEAKQPGANDAAPQSAVQPASTRSTQAPAARLQQVALQTAALDRSKRPDYGTDRPFIAPKVQSARLENGLRIFVVERRELPKVAVDLVTRAGSASDPAGKEGTAFLATRTIDLGTKTRKALEIEDALGDLGTSMGGRAGQESALLSFDVLKRNLAPALTIFSDVARNPVFPEAEVEREKKRHLDALAQESNDASALAGRIAPMLAFGPNHPYGRPAGGLPASIAGLTRADLQRYHDTFWKPASSALVFAGDISLAQAVNLARQSFGNWRGAARAQPSIPTPQPMGAGKVYLVDKPGAAQTVVAQLLPGPRRAAEDYYALRLADAVWGGSFGSRLNLNLREDKGYSYGVSSFPLPYSAFGAWQAQGSVQTNKTKEALVEFQNEFKALSGGKPISEAELSDARSNRVRGYAQGFQSLSRIADRVAGLWALGLPMTELQREVDETEKLALPAVNAAAQKYATANGAALLLVGDRAKIEAGVRELNLGEVVVLDAEGKPLK